MDIKPSIDDPNFRAVEEQVWCEDLIHFLCEEFSRRDNISPLVDKQDMSTVTVYY